MPYSPPSRIALRDSIARDLRDTSYKAFSTQDVDDFINFGIAEVNRVYPIEDIVDYPVVNPATTEYSTTLTSIFRVEAWRAGEFIFLIPPNMGETSRGGWELFAQVLRIPNYEHVLEVSDLIKCWGYGERPALVLDAEVLQGDLDAELGVRTFAVYQGYQRLISDRSLFQQWQTQSNNSDVSPTQLTNMSGLKAAEWDGLRNRIRRLRRSA